MYEVYVEELNDSRIPSRDSAELIKLLLEYSVHLPSLFDGFKVNYLFSLCF